MSAALSTALQSSPLVEDASIALHTGPPPHALVATLSQIESACFDRPWGETGIVEILAQSGAALAYLRAPSSQGATVQGYCIYQRVIDEVEILQLATHPTAQRRGLGRRLVAAVLAQAAANSCVAVFLEVRRGNTAALALYERAGFALCGVRRGYYPSLHPEGAAEDALLLRCDLPLSQKSQ